MISANSSKDPTPPGSTIKASELSIKICFLSRRVSATSNRVSLGLTNSKACNDFSDIPKTSTLFSIPTSETTFIKPTSPPPKTMPIFLLDIIFATSTAAFL